jgi:hypothetical protein
MEQYREINNDQFFLAADKILQDSAAEAKALSETARALRWQLEETERALTRAAGVNEQIVDSIRVYLDARVGPLIATENEAAGDA